MKKYCYTKTLFTILIIISFSQSSEITVSGALRDLEERLIWSMWIPHVCHDFSISFTTEDGELIPGEVFQCGYEGEMCFNIIIDTTLSNDPQHILPNEIKLSQNYPNPFNPTTNLYASVPNQGMFTIYDVLGNEIQSVTLNNAGDYEITWGGINKEGRASPAGVYLYRLSDGISMKTGKMTLLDGGSTSGLSAKPIGNAMPNQQRRKSLADRSVSGTIHLSASCITDLYLPIEVSDDTSLDLYCNTAPYGYNRTFYPTIGTSLYIDLDEEVYHDSPTLYEISASSQCSFIDNHTLRFITYAQEITTVEVTATDSIDTSLSNTFVFTFDSR